MSLSGFETWFMEQVKIVLGIILIILLFVTAYKRAWVAMIGVIIGLAIVGIFVVEPQIIQKLATWLTEKLALGDG